MCVLLYLGQGKFAGQLHPLFSQKLLLVLTQYKLVQGMLRGLLALWNGEYGSYAKEGAGVDQYVKIWIGLYFRPESNKSMRLEQKLQCLIIIFLPSFSEVSPLSSLSLLSSPSLSRSPSLLSFSFPPYIYLNPYFTAAELFPVNHSSSKHEIRTLIN